MSARDPDREAPRPTHAILAAALLAVTALVRVPIELLSASLQDLSGAPREVLLILCSGGALFLLVFALGVVRLPSRLRGLANTVLVGLAIYAWIRAGFFPGPSVNLDGGRLTADLSTGLAGLAVPLVAGLFLAWLGKRQPRIVTTVLAVLLTGGLVQSVAAGVSAWRASPPASAGVVASLLEWSRNGNVLIVILDTLQADVFEEVLEAEPRLREELDGFRFYPSASSNSPTTYLSLPTIHAGRRYDPDRSASRFYAESIYEGSVLNRFADAGYRVSYAMSLGPCPKAVANCVTTVGLERSRGEIAARDASHLLDLGMYRVLPDGLRRAILERGEGLLAATVGRAYLVDRTEAEVAALARVASSSTASDSPPTAKMIHTMITHLPTVLRADCSMGERRFDRKGAISQARCAFKQIVALLRRLRMEKAYDVSNILLIADHGYGFGSAADTESRDPRFLRMLGALNPTVLVKPAHERGPLVISDAPIELTDLAQALCGDAGCSPAEGLRDLEKIDAGRSRDVFWYNWKNGYWNLPQIPKLAQYTIRGDMSKVESWSRKPAAYTPGTVIDFRLRRQNSAPYLGFGWARRQATHQRMVDPRATLSLSARFDRTLDYVLVLKARLGGASSSARTRVRVDVNGVTVGELASGHPGGELEDYRFEVPVGILLRSPETTISFSAEEPASDRDGEEARFAVQTLELRPRP